MRELTIPLSGPLSMFAVWFPSQALTGLSDSVQWPAMNSILKQGNPFSLFYRYIFYLRMRNFLCIKAGLSNNRVHTIVNRDWRMPTTISKNETPSGLALIRDLAVVLSVFSILRANLSDKHPLVTIIRKSHAC